MSKLSEKSKNIVRCVSSGPKTIEQIATYLGLPSKESKLGKRKVRHTVADLAYSGILNSSGNKTRTYTLGPKGHAIASNFHAPLPSQPARVFSNVAENLDTPSAKIIPKEKDLVAPASPVINARTKTVVNTLQDSLDKFYAMCDSDPDQALKLLGKQVILLREEIKKLRSI